MPSEQVEFVTQRIADYNGGDWDSVISNAHPDVEVHVQEDIPNGGVWKGPEGWTRMSEEWLEAWESFEVHPLGFEEEGDRVLARVEQHGVARGSGLEIKGIFWYLFEFRDGLIYRWHLCASEGVARAAFGA